MSDKQFDARLEDWTACPIYPTDGTSALAGCIYDDTVQRNFGIPPSRFPDGKSIMTTPIVSGDLAPGGVVTTESGTRYLLGRAA